MREVLSPRLTLLLVVSAVRQVAGFMLLPFLAIYLHLVLGFSLPVSGLLVGLQYLSGWLMGVVGGYQADRLGLLRAYSVGGVLMAFALAALGLVHGLVWVAVILVIFGAPRPVGRNALDALANRNAKPEHRGAVENYLYWTV